jgi:hypothetical protein
MLPEKNKNFFRFAALSAKFLFTLPLSEEITP